MMMRSENIRAMHLIFMMLGMLVLAVGGSSEAQAQPNVPEAELLERLCAAAGRGDTRALLEPVGDRVEVNLFGVSNFYSRDQAQAIICFFMNRITINPK